MKTTFADRDISFQPPCFIVWGVWAISTKWDDPPLLSGGRSSFSLAGRTELHPSTQKVVYAFPGQTGYANTNGIAAFEHQATLISHSPWSPL